MITLKAHLFEKKLKIDSTSKLVVFFFICNHGINFILEVNQLKKSFGTKDLCMCPEHSLLSTFTAPNSSSCVATKTVCEQAGIV